jgi:hypothetical protein
MGRKVRRIHINKLILCGLFKIAHHYRKMGTKRSHVAVKIGLETAVKLRYFFRVERCEAAHGP